MNDKDSLVELRAWRDEFARSHGYDVHAMCAALRELDQAAGQQVVHGNPRRPATVKRTDTKSPNKTTLPNESAISGSRGNQPLPVAEV